MIKMNQLEFYWENHDCTIETVIKPVSSTKLTQKIDESIKKINELGGTNKVICIVIEKIEDSAKFDTVIYLQSEDNGDKCIYLISKEYKELTSLIEGLSVYCQANDLIYNKI